MLGPRIKMSMHKNSIMLDPHFYLDIDFEFLIASLRESNPIVSYLTKPKKVLVALFFAKLCWKLKILSVGPLLISRDIKL